MKKSDDEILKKINIKEIYDHIADDTSKEIFLKRLLYSLTCDKSYMLNVINTTIEGKKVNDILSDNSVRPFIFGAGIWGKDIASTYGTNKFKGYIDNNARKKQYCNLPVFSFEEYTKGYKNELVIISSRLYYREMYEQLLGAGVNEEYIVNLGEVLDEMSKRQYFDLPDLKEAQVEDEVFVDAGCFDGRTSLEFMTWCENNFKKMYAFEPDAENYKKCKQLFEQKIGKDKYVIIEKGVWNKEEVLHFSSIANGGSNVSEDGESKIVTTTIDQVVEERISFIKMDLEGSEYMALLGAKNQIKNNKPKLAISVYHKPEDIWELPELILQMNKDYKFYFRHYSVGEAETVLYAI